MTSSTTCATDDERLQRTADVRGEPPSETFTEWANRLFEFEFCENCGGDTEDHFPLLVNEHWVAMCKLDEEEN